ncbi:hypothetical protein SLW70_04115 [Flavobacterium sp. NG2]|uniref:hypothetical protein n=1 Tax=Flavobacterium sp. NG2 TaxID=3097547 RepID=UPI002A7F5FD2|nr:hypothetical protein [Flavobacterium sp. NG2]WPR72333.1 hypothetical protein SLW70_04115 [Flavobacterium sp. NG2]
MEEVYFKFQISLGGYIPKFEKSGDDVFVDKRIRQKKKFLKIFKNKKRLNFIVLNLLVVECID